MKFYTFSWNRHIYIYEIMIEAFCIMLNVKLLEQQLLLLESFAFSQTRLLGVNFVKANFKSAFCVQVCMTTPQKNSPSQILIESSR